MHQHLTKCLLAFALALGLPATLPIACVAESSGTTTLTGERVTLGSGTAYTWTRLDAAGKPSAIGVSLSGEAVMHPPATETEISIALPAVNGLPFKTVVIDWNPRGHEPQFYSVPHFDFHFYVIDEATRMKIAGAASGPRPEASLVPAGFVSNGSVIPMMGMHYVPANAPELHGGVFTQTPIYGYANQSLAFIEPMITQSFLLQGKSVDPDLALPAKYERPGYYPTQYSIFHDSAHGEYVIALSRMKNV